MGPNMYFTNPQIYFPLVLSFALFFIFLNQLFFSTKYLNGHGVFNKKRLYKNFQAPKGRKLPALGNLYTGHPQIPQYVRHCCFNQDRSYPTN